MNSRPTVARISSLFVAEAFAFLAAFGASALLAPHAAAQNVKLNEPLLRYTTGGVLEARQTPDGSRYVYVATEGSQVPGLFSVPVDGRGSSTQLLPLGMAFDRFELSSEWVVVSDRRDLYVVPVDGSRPPSVLLPRAPLRSIGQIGISADGSRVVYLANLAGVGKEELFSARIDADKQPVKLNAVSPAGRIWGFEISPESRNVVYIADQDRPGAVEIYSAAIDGSSPPVKLNRPLVPGFGVRIWNSFLISPEGTRVVYCADQDRNDVYEIYSAPMDGSSSAVKLNAPLPFDRNVAEYRISADGIRVVYVADQDANDVWELFGVPIDGSSAPVQLNGPLVPGGDVGFDFEISPDSRTVTFRAQQQSPSGFELYVAPIDGRSAARRLQPDAFGPGHFSPDGRRLVYRVREGVGPIDLYSVPIARGQGVNLTMTSDPLQWLYEFLVSPDGPSVVYVEYTGGGTQLRRVPLLGGSPPAVLGRLYAWEDLELSHDGRFALFRATATFNEVYELFSVPVDGQGEVTRLNGPLVTDHIIGDVSSMQVSPQGSVVFATQVPDHGEDGDNNYMELFSVAPGLDPVPIRLAPPEIRISAYEFDAGGQRIVFKAGGGEEGDNLFSVPTDGHLPPLQLDDPAATHGEALDFALSPGGEFVVFDAEVGYWSQLFRVALDGGPEIVLTGELVFSGRIQSFQVAPGGDRVVYVADQFINDRFELFSVASDGSAAPVRLNGPLAAGADVDAEFLITPDGLTVVARAELAEDNVRELYRIPVDGSAAPARLSAPLAAGGNVAPGFRISADGRTVVYLADQELDERFELFAVPLDGGTGPVKLNGALVDGGDALADFALTPDGERVVYRADAETDGRFELFGVALDGSANPVKLNPPLVADGDVRPGFLLAPEGSRVIYRADRSVDEKIELFSSRVAGGATFTLNDALPLGGGVLDALRLGPDGKQVFYVADQRTDDVFELYAAPIDRAKGSRLLSGPLPPGGDVGLFEPTPDGKGIVYLADQDTDSVVELYLSLLALSSSDACSPGAPVVGAR